MVKILYHEMGNLLMRKKLFITLGIIAILFTVLAGPFLTLAILGFITFPISFIALAYSLVKRNGKNAKLSIIITGISAVLFIIGASRLPTSEKEDTLPVTKTEVSSSILSESSTSSTEEISLAFTSDSLETDSAGLVTIKGITMPNAIVYVSSEPKGSEKTADSKGNFELDYNLGSNSEKTLTIISKLNGKETSQIITIKPSVDYIATLKAKEESLIAEKEKQTAELAQIEEEKRIAEENAKAEQARIAEEQKQAAEQEKIAAEQAEQARIAAEQAQATQQAMERTVYIAPESGTKYHYSSTCRGLRNANSVVPINESEAILSYTLCGFED